MAKPPIQDGDRKRPEDFLDHTVIPKADPKAGSLKVYIGSAAGVGKTYRMLQEAHQLKAHRHDVVIGFIETHGRAETVAQLDDLEQVPLREIPYRGVVLHEMDLDGIIARNPEVALVDELAHTNASGSRHPKRYQDVEELVAHGINVITALNIQHLESLSYTVKQIAGVDIRETVPDSFLAKADQVVTVDVTVEDLRQRLREGKIYPPDRVEAALKNFFKQSNLSSLRELALREVARDQSRQREQFEQIKRGGGRRAAVGERLMVCVSSNPDGTDEILRRATRIAGRLNADLYAVHVETPAESMRKISTSDFRALLDHINLAADLGAEVVWLKGTDVLNCLLDFAHEKKITQIIVGRTHFKSWNRFLRNSLTNQLIARASHFDVVVVSEDEKP
ncbi:MAG TPA: universal stress protein [Candidatus Binataceae bacterium]|nr:universal stress protein [Candidatus Binataceae bacterium]